MRISPNCLAKLPIHLPLLLGGLILLVLGCPSCSTDGEDVHQAAFKGHLGRIQAYLAAGGNVDSVGESQYSLLNYAALGGQVEVMQYLLAHGAAAQKRAYGQGLLQEAARSGNVNAASFLLDRGARVNDATGRDSLLGGGGQTPLLLAAQQLDYPMATYLLSKGAQPNRQDDNGNTPLLIAIFSAIPPKPASANQIYQFVKLLVEHGANVNLTDNKGSSPLALAALTENQAVVDYLVHRGATINSKGENGETAFSYAAGEANQTLCEYLVRAGARPADRLADGRTVLMNALRSNKVAFLRWLIPTYRYNVQARDSSGQTLLMYAITTSDATTTSFVMNDLKLDVNAQDNQGVTSLMLAAKNLELDKIKLLVEKGSRLNTQDQEGLTALMYVAAAAQTNDSGPDNEQACKEAVQYLVAHGGRTDLKSRTGWAAVDYVKDKPFPELIALLK